jgi:hypothetical protein
MAPSEAPSSSPSSELDEAGCPAARTTSPARVNLGSACNYAILAESGISTAPASIITGDIGVSPIDSTAITGFGLTLDSSGQFSTASQITGKAFAADYSSPTPANLTTVIVDVKAAYNDAAGRTTTDATRQNFEDGTIDGQTLPPGVYTFTVPINIDSDITFAGGPDDVFIIQATKSLTQASNTQVILSGCAQAKNIFWQVAGVVSIGTNASMQGILLTKKKAVFATGSSLVGSVLAGTAVTLDMTTITQAADTCNTSPSTCSCDIAPTVESERAPSKAPSPTPSSGLSGAACPAPSPTSPAPVDINSACSYAILAETGISTVPASAITGNIGVSPIASGALTGFTLTLDSSGQFSTSAQVSGKAFAADYSGTTTENLAAAVKDVKAAYTNALQRPNTDTTRQNIKGGTIGGQTLTAGIYTFTVPISINSDITFEGGADDVFIIQSTSTLTQAANTQVILSGCVQAKNIFWQVADVVSIGANASMQGTILSKTKSVFGTGSSLEGSVLAQTAVTLDMTTITQAAGTCTAT